MRKLLWVSVALTVVLLGTACSVWWYWQRPAKSFEDAMAKLKEAKTQHFNAAILTENADTTLLLGEKGQVEVTIDGAFARQDDRRDSVQLMAAVTSKTESVSVHIEGEVRFIDDAAYILVKKAPQALPLVAQVKGAWLILPRGGQESPMGAADEQLFTGIKGQGREKVAGTSTRKYQAVATAGAVLHFLDSVADLFGTRLTAEQIDGIRKSLASIQEVPVELWITPWTHELRQLRTVLAMPGGNAMKFTLNLSGRNKSVDIAAPEGAVAIEEALKASLPQQTREQTPAPSP